MLIVGDLSADPGVIPCLAKCIASGRMVRSLRLLVGLGWMRWLVPGETSLSLALTP